MRKFVRNLATISIVAAMAVAVTPVASASSAIRARATSANGVTAVPPAQPKTVFYYRLILGATSGGREMCMQANGVGALLTVQYCALITKQEWRFTTVNNEPVISSRAYSGKVIGDSHATIGTGHSMSLQNAIGDATQTWSVPIEPYWILRNALHPNTYMVGLASASAAPGTQLRVVAYQLCICDGTHEWRLQGV